MEAQPIPSLLETGRAVEFVGPASGLGQLADWDVGLLMQRDSYYAGVKIAADFERINKFSMVLACWMTDLWAP
jgi:hypothetical protein